MSNIVIAFSKPEVAAGIKKILTQSGYSVQAVCTTGAQALASVNNLECGILICGCRFMDMMYMEIHDYLPPELLTHLFTFSIVARRDLRWGVLGKLYYEHANLFFWYRWRWHRLRARPAGFATVC